MKVLFLFLDGVGIGPADPDVNPLLQASLPCLRSLLGGSMPTLEEPACGSDSAQAIPTDAVLGVSGTPQSGTGQTALFSGHNGPALFGRHFGPWVPVRLRPLLAQDSILAQAQAQGFRCAFANAYPSQYRERAWSKRPAGPPVAAHGAGLLTRDERDLAKGDAVTSEITNQAWITRLGFTDLPDPSPAEAGRNLATIASGADLTFFAHYGTDTAGHERSMEAGVRTLEKVDRFLEGLRAALEPDTLLVISSDHGNLEDITRGHTTNRVFTLVAGPDAPRLSTGVSRITHVPGLILNALAGEHRPAPDDMGTPERKAHLSSRETPIEGPGPTTG